MRTRSFVGEDFFPPLRNAVLFRDRTFAHGQFAQIGPPKLRLGFFNSFFFSELSLGE